MATCSQYSCGSHQKLAMRPSPPSNLRAFSLMIAEIDSARANDARSNAPSTRPATRKKDFA